eukprot:jgi/Mesvir1/26796/Mv20563-RA.1
MGQDMPIDPASGSAGEPVLVIPRNDKKEYHVFHLENGMKALVISDPETDKAAAAMDVAVGYYSDPHDIPGIAHFLEHMLFFSSEKYPQEDQYSKWLSEHGGHSNAYTSCENTNYHFDVNQEHLEGALDRFAQFFTCPVFARDATAREVNAVDSENTKNLLSDRWRMNQLMQHLAREEHPYHHFGTGNLSTLDVLPSKAGIDVREKVIEFYRQHYSSNVMCLAVYGREPVERLKQLVKEKFDGVANRSIHVPRIPGDPCGDKVKLLAKVVPVTEGHSLELQWQTPSEIGSTASGGLGELGYRCGAHQFLGHLLGHEGKGSIFALLKELGWVTALSAGTSSEASHAFYFFTISMELTEEGHVHMEEVVSFVFQYIAIVKRAGVQQWLFDEVKEVSEMKFHFRDKIPPFTYVGTLARAMQLFHPSDYVSGSRLPQVYDPAAIHAVLDCLTVDRVRIFWLSKAFDGMVAEREPWYQTSYEWSPLPEEMVKMWTGTPPDCRLSLPPPNAFIPTDFELKKHPMPLEYPVLFRMSPLSRLWYKPDTKFATPKAFLWMDFVAPDAVASPEASVLSRLFTKLVVDYLNETAYSAEIAGLGYQVHGTNAGYQVLVYGYSHKLFTLVRAIMDTIINFKVDPVRFQIVQDKLKKDYQNFRFQQPYQHAMYTTSVLLEQGRWHVNEYLQVIDRLKAADLGSLYARMMGRLFFDCFINGNVTGEEAAGLVAAVEEMFMSKHRSLPLFASQLKEPRILRLPSGAELRRRDKGPSPEDDNSALVGYLQVGADESRLNVMVSLLVQMAQRDAYYQLRTVEQLGYIVFLLPRLDFGISGIQFIIQSSVQDPDYLDGRVESFLASFTDQLDNMTDEAFKEHVDTLVAVKLEKHKNLSEESVKMWQEIESGQLKFDRVPLEVAALQELTLDDMREFFKHYVQRLGKDRRKLCVQVWGRKHVADMPGPICLPPGTPHVAAMTPTIFGLQGAPRVPPAPTPMDDLAGTKGSTGSNTSGDGPSSSETGMTSPRETAGPEVVDIVDLYAFKRSCEIFPSGNCHCFANILFQ